MYEVLILAGVVGAMGATGFVLDWRRDKKAEPESEPEPEKIHQVISMGPYRSMSQSANERRRLKQHSGTIRNRRWCLRRWLSRRRRMGKSPRGIMGGTS